MSDRPTSEQLANAIDSVVMGVMGYADGPNSHHERLRWLRDRLRSGGVIVDPADHPLPAEPDADDYTNRVYWTYAHKHWQGRAEMRADIFGGGV